MFARTRQIKEKLLSYIEFLRLSPLAVQVRHGSKRCSSISSLAENLFYYVEVKTCLYYYFAYKDCFFIILVRTCIKSVRKIFRNQIVFTSSSKVIPFSKYLHLDLIAVLSHTKWANIIIAQATFLGRFGTIHCDIL